MDLTQLETIELDGIEISIDEPNEHRGWREYRVRLRGDGTSFIQMFNDPTCGWNALRDGLFPNAHLKKGHFEVSPSKRDTQITWVLVIRYYCTFHQIVPEDEVIGDCRRLLLALKRYQKREEGRS